MSRSFLSIILRILGSRVEFEGIVTAYITEGCADRLPQKATLLFFLLLS